MPRSFQPASMAGLCCHPSWPAALAVALLTPSLRAADPIDLVPQIKPGDMAQVTVELEVGGHVQVPAEDLEQGAEQSAVGETKSVPMSVVATLRYDERLLDSSSSDASGALPVRAVRYYDQADAVIKVDEGGLQPQLPDDHRLIVAERTANQTRLSCPTGLLTREHFDLIDVVGSSLWVNELLPTKPVAEGDSWAQNDAVMAGLLTLDSVAVCEVQSVLEEFNDHYAKVRLAGTVHGTADGAATQMDLRAVYLFDRQLGRITRMNLAIKEKRAIGGATPGVEGIAQLRLKIVPIESSEHLTDQVVASLPPADPARPDEFIYEAAQQGFRLRHDRQWFVTSEEREIVTLRRVDRTDLVAQCTITRLSPKSEGRHTTLEQFQKDIAYSLGKSFEQLVSSRQWANPHGLHCFEVIARGKVQEVPVEWHYFLAAPDSGPRLTVAVTIEGTMVERLGQADRKLVESLELLPNEGPPNASAFQPANSTTR